MPCTLGYRFLIRQGRLEMHTSMRSQDLWLGFPYDIFATTLLQELMAGWLGVEVGEYHHHVDSLHLYADHAPAAAECLHHKPTVTEMDPVDVDWPSLDVVLAQVISGDERPARRHPVGHVRTGADQLPDMEARRAGPG